MISLDTAIQSLSADIARRAIDPNASNSEIAGRLGMDCDGAFASSAAKARRCLGMPNRRRGSAPKESSLFNRMRIAITANPAATNREIAALVGAPYSHSLATMCSQLRKKLGIAPRRQPAASVP